MTNCVTLILAGGRGERLGSLTNYTSKPAVHFGGSKRIIDFTLNNCVQSGIGPIGVITQYHTSELHRHIGGKYWDQEIYLLPSSLTGSFYHGTADAVYKNTAFIEKFNPDYVLILAGDHIYNMDYREMIDFHVNSGADITVASHRVPLKSASGYGVIMTDASNWITGFEEKPANPKSNLASMGIYVFKWNALREYLIRDHMSLPSRHDFGHSILPLMRQTGAEMRAYEYPGYWRDVGTIDNLWSANMEALDLKSMRSRWQIEDYHFGGISENGPFGLFSVRQSIIPDSCSIMGRVEHSVLGDNVIVSKGACVVNSVIMPNAYIGSNVMIHHAIIGEGAEILDNSSIGSKDGSRFFADKDLCVGGASLVEPYAQVPKAIRIQGYSHITNDKLQEWNEAVRRIEEKAPVIGWLLPELAGVQGQEPLRA